MTMIKRISILIAAYLFIVAVACSQTTVNLTVTDTPDNQTWNNGTWSVQLQPAPGSLSQTRSFTLTGGGSTAAQSGSLSGTGTASITLPANANIGPSSVWQFTVCPQATAACFQQSVTVSTSSPQTLNINPPSIRISLPPNASPAPVLAYATGEIASASLGSTFWLIGTGQQQCSAVSGSTCTTWTSGGGGGVTITTVSGLNSISGKTKGTIAVVTDGSSVTDCTTGGGSVVVVCQYSGTSWAQLVAASSGATAFSAISAGTNTASLQMGTGGALTATGTGSIVATSAPFSGLTGSASCGQLPALTGDVTTSAGSCADSIANGAVTNAKLANAATTVNGQACTLGSSCNVNNGAATNSVAINQGNGSAQTGVAGAVTGGVFTANNGAAPSFNSPGIADGNGGAVVSTSPYTILCDSATALRDRATTIRFQSGASTINTPDHTAAGCGSNMVFTLIDDGAGTLTINRGGSDTFSIFNGSPTSNDGATTFSLSNGQYATLNNGTGTVWEVRIVTSNATQVNGANVPISATLLASNGSGQLTGATLNSANLYVGNGSNLPVGVSASGDVTLSNTGAFTVTQVNGATVPTSASVLGSNASKQLVVDTAHNITLPLQCAAASGSGTAYTCTTSPSFTPADGDAILFEADVANTGSATLNVNSSSAATIKKQGGGTNLAANDLLAGQDTLLIYDGTNWQMQGQVGNANGAGTVTTTGSPASPNLTCFSGATSITNCANVSAHQFYGNNTGSSAAPVPSLIGASDVGPNEWVAGAGTAQAQTATLTPAVTTLTDGLYFCWKPTAANTGAGPTLAVNGLTATTITKLGNTALVANDIVTTANACVIYNSSGPRFELQNPQVTTGSGTVTSIATTQPIQGGTITATGTISFGMALGSGSGTANQLACVIATNTMGNCTTLPPNNFLGVFLAGGTTYTTQGVQSVVIDATQNVTFGDILCASPTAAAKAHDNGSTPCTNGEWVGIVTTTASSISTVTASLRLQ